MAKILLVEDDNNLREIYEARLQAEGYTIVSAKDGEEALVKAKQERPDLIISDVMMPRISGFEMLDILRNTDGMKDVKVIMLTALGQAEDKTRADALGADRYLVKSQVTLEDIVKAADELLADITAPPATVPEAAAAVPAPAAATTVNAAQVPPATAPVVVSQPATPAVPTVTAPAVSAAPIAAPTAPISAAVPAAQTPAVAPIPVATPAVAAPTIPVVAAPTTAPTTAPKISMPTQPATEPVVTTPQPAAPVVAAPQASAAPAAPTASPEESDDKLMATAVQNLAATLGGSAPAVAAEPPAPVDAPAPPNPEQKLTAPEPASVAIAPQAFEPAPEVAPAKASEPETPSTLPDFAAPKIEEPEANTEPTTVPELAPGATEESAVAAPPEVSTPAPETSPDTPQPAAPAAEEPVPAVTSAPSTADEQAVMQAQIEDYINQPVSPTPEPADEQNQSTSAPEVTPAPAHAAAQTPAETATVPEQPQADATSIISPTIPRALAPEPTPDNKEDNQEPGNVAIAHKKVISPPAGAATTQPDLKALLAKEGIGDFGDHADNDAPMAPDGTIAPPHPPGHVISPNAAPTTDGDDYAADDPNNIAL